MDRSTRGITAQEHEEVSSAIRNAEKQTSGEIFAVVAQESDDYFYVSSFVAAAWSLLLGVAIATTAWFLDQPVTALILVAGQIAGFLTFLIAFYFLPNVRLWFVPRSVAYRRASANAVRQFLAHGIHNTEGRSGVLLFVSIAERYAEVVADSGINAKVDQGEWNSMVATLVDHAAKDDLARGYIIAIGQAGSLLAKHFPPTNDKQNELNDKLVEI